MIPFHLAFLVSFSWMMLHPSWMQSGHWAQKTRALLDGSPTPRYWQDRFTGCARNQLFYLGKTATDSSSLWVVYVHDSPTSPRLALSSSGSSNSHLRSKAPTSLCSPERTHHQRTSRRCSLPNLRITHSLSHVTSNEGRFPAMLWLTHGCALPSHDLLLAFSHIRQESVSASTKRVSSIWGTSVLNKHMQERAVPPLALLST